MQIHLLVFHTPPQPLDQHVVAPAAGAIHADSDVVLLEEPRELLAGELAALVGVEELRRAIAGQGLLDRLETEVGRQRVGQPPRQHPATRPIQDGEQIHEASAHRDVGDVGGPHLVRASDLQLAQQI